MGSSLFKELVVALLRVRTFSPVEIADTSSLAEGKFDGLTAHVGVLQLSL